MLFVLALSINGSYKSIVILILKLWCFSNIVITNLLYTKRYKVSKFITLMERLTVQTLYTAKAVQQCQNRKACTEALKYARTIEIFVYIFISRMGE